MRPTARFILAGAASWLSGARAATNATAPADATARQNMLQLIHLRWLAVAGQVATILLVHHGLGFALPLGAMGAVLAALVALNLVSLLRLKRLKPLGRNALFLALAFDALALTAQLSLSGGVTNPFTLLYLLHVILGAVLLEAWATWAIVGLTSLCFLGLTSLYRPISAPGLADGEFFRLFIVGLLIGFVIDAILLVVFVGRINANLRGRDARLADLRQKAAEEDHIVRMGLLASGAAHELGTPLATLDVILGDWRRMPVFTADPELAQELEDMRAEVRRCKTIVTGVLLSAGEARGGEQHVSTLSGFMDEVVGDWRTSRTVGGLAYEADLSSEVLIVSDSALKQVIHNVLDNALEASPQGAVIRAQVEGEDLVIVVEDEGPGFDAQRLGDFGKPYNSSKGRAGGGLGLFLVVNVARKLGGAAQAMNRPGGGARVTLTLPLAALQIETLDGR
jgi:two-component system sensor histidine kinase RegB